MTVSVLPPSPSAFAKASWDDVAPYFDDLAARPLDPSTIEAWLAEWSRLEELVTEAASRAMIAYTIDTSDREKEADHLRFSTEVLPKMEERSVELARRLVALGPDTPELATTLARFRTSIEIFREANVPIFSELEELSARIVSERTIAAVAKTPASRVPVMPPMPWTPNTSSESS